MTTTTHATHEKSKTGKPRQRAKARRGGLLARGTESLESVHRAIAQFPLDVLEQIERLKRPVARVRKLQDRSITATYDLVRGVNREIVRLVSERPAGKPAKKRVAKKTSAARPAKVAARSVHPPPAEAVAS